MFAVIPPGDAAAQVARPSINLRAPGAERLLAHAPLINVPSLRASERGSRTKYVLWGAAVGSGIGLALGVASYNNSRCTDCWVPNEAIPPFGFLVGATAGALVGLLVHAMTPAAPSPPE